MKLKVKLLFIILSGIIPALICWSIFTGTMPVISTFILSFLVSCVYVYIFTTRYFVKDIERTAAALETASLKDAPARISEMKNSIDHLINELRISKEQFTVFTDKRYELVIRYTKDHNITFVNKPFVRFTGLKADQLIGKNILSLFNSDSEFVVNGILNPDQAIKDDRKFDFEKDSYWVEWSFSTVLNSKDEVTEYQVIGHDITDRKRVEEALRGSKARNLALLKAIPDMVFRFHRDGSLLDYHLPPSDNTRIPTERLLTNNLYGVFAEDLTEKIKMVVDQAFMTGDIHFFEQQTIEADEIYYEEIRVVATEEDEYIVIIRDITERKQAEDEIKRYIEEMQFNEDIIAKNSFELQELYGKLTESESELKELNAKKDKFFSIISHDLRSPFTAIVGFSRILVEDLEELPPDQLKTFAANILEASENVLKLLENLLYWSRLQTNRIQYEPQQLILKTVVDDTLGLYKANCLEKNIIMSNCIPADAVAWGDRNMLDAVLRNLLSNALKFTRSSGTIIIGGKKYNDFIEIFIEDSGVGISPENLCKLFKIDEHVTTQGTNKEKGTGLGLILCKEFIEKNGGTIRVESKVNIGSKFIFTLPSA